MASAIIEKFIDDHVIGTRADTFIRKLMGYEKGILINAHEFDDTIDVEEHIFLVRAHYRDEQGVFLVIHDEKEGDSVACYISDHRVLEAMNAD